MFFKSSNVLFFIDHRELQVHGAVRTTPQDHHERRRRVARVVPVRQDDIDVDLSQYEEHGQDNIVSVVETTDTRRIGATFRRVRTCSSRKEL